MYVKVVPYSVKKLIRSASGVRPSKLKANTHGCSKQIK